MRQLAILAPQRARDRLGLRIELEHEMNRAARGVGGALVIEGEPGVGKTSLLDAANELALEHPVRLLRARGGELERGFPFGIAAQLLTGAVAGLGPAERRSLLSGAAALAASVVDPSTAGGAFEGTVEISTRGQSATNPRVASDAAGEGFVVWERSDGKHTIISGFLPVRPSGPPNPGGGHPPVGGCVNHPGLPPCPPPKLRLLRLTPGTSSTAGRIVHGHCVKPTHANAGKRHCVRPIAVTISFTLPSAATVTLTVKRVTTGRISHGRCVAATTRNPKKRHCTLLANVRGRITLHAKSGKNKLTFNGRIGGHVLTPGAYRMLVTPSASGRAGTAVAAAFKIVG